MTTAQAIDLMRDLFLTTFWLSLPVLGVGFVIGNAGNNLRTDVLFFGVLLFTAAGLTSVAVLDWFERRFETWRPKVGSAA